MSRATRWIVVLASVGSLMAALDTLVVASALGAIRQDLGASLTALEWTVNAYNLAFAVLLVTGAALGDRLGRARMYAAGLVLFALASAGCALAPDAGWLVAARGLQGAGAALVTPLGLALLTAAFPAERRGTALGLFSAITGLAVASGPLVGGAVVEGLAWQWVFWLNVPIGLLAAPLVLAKVPERRGPDAALDVRGLVLVGAAAFALVWGLVRGNSAGWGSAEVVLALAAAVVLAAAFAAWERRAPAAMLPPALLRARGAAAGNAAIFCTFGGLFAAVFFMAQLMQVGLGTDALGAGLRLLPWTATFLTVAPAAGALADRVGERPLLAGGLVLNAAGLAWLAAVADPGVAYATLLGPLLLAGVGVSMAIPAAQGAALAGAAAEQLGKAAGANSMLRELGGVFGIAVAVAVFAGAGGYGSPAAFVDGFVPAMAAAAAIALCGAAAGLLVPRRAPALVPAALAGEAA